MPKQTLEAALLARRDDPRGLRGAISIVKGKPRIVFGVVGEHRRFSVDVKGDEIVLVDDPRADDEAEAENSPEGAPDGADGGDTPEKDDDPAETAGNQGEEPVSEPAAEASVEVEAETTKKPRGK